MNTSTISSNSEERMGTAPIFKLMLSMGIPTFVAQLINLLYNIVDRIYIGHIPEVGAASLTGIGLCLPIITLVSAFSVFVGAGGAPLASIALGKDDRDKAQRILSNGVTLLIIFTVIVMAVIYTLKKPLLYFFGASDATYPHADDYLSIYLIGTIFVMITTGLNTFITAQGQSKTAMFSVLIGAIFNIILDPIFIFALNLGIKGAAIATVISQAISAAWVIRFLTSDKASLRISAQMMRPQGKLILSIAALGVSPFIMQVTESLITIVFTHGLQKYGDDHTPKYHADYIYPDERFLPGSPAHHQLQLRQGQRGQSEEDMYHTDNHVHHSVICPGWGRIPVSVRGSRNIYLG